MKTEDVLLALVVGLALLFVVPTRAERIYRRIMESR